MNKLREVLLVALMVGTCVPAALADVPAGASPSRPAEAPADLWPLARKHAETFRFSTLFTAQEVRDWLSKPDGITKAIRWCRATAVTRVFVETFRDGYTADRDTLVRARDAFKEAGLLVSGCVTTTDIGRESVRGWRFPCFSEQAGLNNLKRIFEYTAGLFDEIMIDDFLATMCECEDCVKARGEKSWSQFRLEQMADVSRRYVLEPARRINPRVKLIIKYPCWYDAFHQGGYDVAGQTAMFDKMWVGTETRDPDNLEWGHKPQYEAYFIMRWLGQVGGAKCGGGWFDYLGTTPPTYLEQARQTVLGGAREAMLFCYGGLHTSGGQADVEALRKEIPGLFELAELVHGKKPWGIAAPKPPNSDAHGNMYVYGFIGMLGLPLVPEARVRADVQAAFLPVQALKHPQTPAVIAKIMEAKTPVLLTRQLAEKLPKDLRLEGNVEVLDIPADAWELVNLPRERLRAIRKHLLTPLGMEFEAPSRVALYLFDEGLVAVENFNDFEVEAQVTLRGASRPELALALPAGSTKVMAAENGATLKIQPRSLAMLRFKR